MMISFFFFLVLKLKEIGRSGEAQSDPAGLSSSSDPPGRGAELLQFGHQRQNNGFEVIQFNLNDLNIYLLMASTNQPINNNNNNNNDNNNNNIIL